MVINTIDAVNVASSAHVKTMRIINIKLNNVKIALSIFVLLVLLLRDSTPHPDTRDCGA